MNLEKTTRENRYFEFRNVTAVRSGSIGIPHWLRGELCPKDGVILDYGCGLGQLLKSLDKEGFTNVHGVEIENRAIEYCRRNNLNVKRLKPNGECNPFGFKFDIVMLLHVIEHMPKEQIIDLLVSLRVDFLKPGGNLLISVPNAQSSTGCYWAYEDWTHSTIFTSGSLYYVLRAAGYHDVMFLDEDCTAGKPRFKAAIIRLLLSLYRARVSFWNLATNSSFHKSFPDIYSYEIKVKATKQ